MSEYNKIDIVNDTAVYDYPTLKITKPSGDPLNYEELVKQCFYLKETNIGSGVLHGQLAMLEANKSVFTDEQIKHYKNLKDKHYLTGILSSMLFQLNTKGKISLVDYKNMKNFIGNHSTLVDPPFGVHKDTGSDE